MVEKIVSLEQKFQLCRHTLHKTREKVSDTCFYDFVSDIDQLFDICSHDESQIKKQKTNQMNQSNLVLWYDQSGSWTQK